MVHNIGGKQQEITGRDGCQSNLVVFTNPSTGSPPRPILCKKFFMIEFHSISHDVISSPGQLVCQRTMGDHFIGLSSFTSIKCPGILIIATGKFCRLGKRPGQILITVFAVALSFLRIVAFPFSRNLATIRSKIPYFFETFYVACLQHNSHGEDLAESGDGL